MDRRTRQISVKILAYAENKKNIFANSTITIITINRAEEFFKQNLFVSKTAEYVLFVYKLLYN